MATSRATLAAIAATAVVTAVIANTAPVRAVSNAIQAVFVVNTAANPVPVRSIGTSAVSGTVGLASGAKVGIDPAANTVQISNSLINPVDVSTVATAPAQPFQAQLHVVFTNALTSTAQFTIPSGERLVIEEVSVSAAPYPPDGITTLSTTVAGVAAAFTLPAQFATFNPNGGGTGYLPTGTLQQVRLYADPGTIVQATVQNNHNEVGESMDVSVSGYLVPLS